MRTSGYFIVYVFVLFTMSCKMAWSPQANILPTPWSHTVSPEHALSSYPRSQLRRDQWMNLNGHWQYTLEPVRFKPVQGLIKEKTMTTGTIPVKWDGTILVNGWLTYDRKVSKIEPDTLAKIHHRLFVPATMGAILPFYKPKTSRWAPASWQREFILDTIPAEMAVAVKGFDNGEIWINDTLFRKTKLKVGKEGAVINYYPFLPQELSLLKAGSNTIKVKLAQGKKGDYSAVGIFQLTNNHSIF